jgi:hypothetical protein
MIEYGTVGSSCLTSSAKVTFMSQMRAMKSGNVVQLATTPIETNNEYGFFWWLETLSGSQAFAAGSRAAAQRGGA